MLLEEVQKVNEDFTILFVDDNSPDGTGDLLEQLSQQRDDIKVLHREKKLGLGSAYIAGFKYALKHGYDYIFEMDADLSHDPKYLPGLLKLLQDHDMVVATRYHDGRVSVINWPLWRLILSRIATLYVKLITRMPLSDSTSGYKCFRRTVLEGIDLDTVKSNGYSFQIEMSYRAYKKGFKIGELPIVFVERMNGDSKMTKKIILEAILIVWRLKLNI